MARRLAYTVHVPVYEPVDPKKPSGEKYVTEHKVFEAGSTLPKWAADLVGDHVYEEGGSDDEPDDKSGKSDSSGSGDKS